MRGTVSRFALFVLCIVGMRVVLGTIGYGVLSAAVSTTQFQRLAAATGVAHHFGVEPSGDDLRRGELHPDLVQDGMVVRRNGQLVVLTNSDDPDAEEFVALERGPAISPGALGSISLLGGTAVFFVGLGMVTLLRRREAASAGPAASRHDDLVRIDDM